MGSPVYSVKGLKFFRGIEGRGFNATLYRDNKRLGTIIDDAHGGPLMVELSHEDRQALNDYVHSLPDVTCSFIDPDTGKPAIVKPSVDLFLSNLVNLTDMLNRIRKLLKKPNMLVVLDKGEVYRIEYMSAVNTKIIDDYRKTYPDHLILNRLSEDEIMGLLETHAA